LRSVEECYRGSNVRVFRIDRARTIERLRTRAREVLERRPDVMAIWLFGSLARGNAVPGSDADLYVIVRDSAASPLDRSVDLARQLSGLGIGCDVIVHTEAEQRDLAARGDAFVRVVEREGVCLAGREIEVPPT
jgi:predicted nucleotidyltransferase